MMPTAPWLVCTEIDANAVTPKVAMIVPPAPSAAAFPRTLVNRNVVVRSKHDSLLAWLKKSSHNGVPLGAKVLGRVVKLLGAPGTGN